MEKLAINSRDHTQVLSGSAIRLRDDPDLSLATHSGASWEDAHTSGHLPAKRNLLLRYGAAATVVFRSRRRWLFADTRLVGCRYSIVASALITRSITCFTEFRRFAGKSGRCHCQHEGGGDKSRFHQIPFLRWIRALLSGSAISSVQWNDLPRNDFEWHACSTRLRHRFAKFDSYEHLSPNILSARRIFWLLK